MYGSKIRVAEQMRRPIVGTTPRSMRDEAPREISRSLMNVIPTSVTIDAMLGKPNIAPAWTRVKPRPFSKYDGRKVSNAATMAYIGIDASHAPRKVPDVSTLAHGTFGSLSASMCVA